MFETKVVWVKEVHKRGT